MTNCLQNSIRAIEKLWYVHTVYVRVYVRVRVRVRGRVRVGYIATQQLSAVQCLYSSAYQSL